MIHAATGASTIRQARADDAEALTAIGRRMFAVAHREAFATEGELAAVIARDWCRERIEAEIADPATAVFVAEVDGRPVGLTCLRPGTMPFSGVEALELCRVYLDEPCFGRGIGAALLDAAVNHLRAAGDPRSWLIAWERNDRAIPMYESRGYVRTAAFPYGEAEHAPIAVLMERVV